LLLNKQGTGYKLVSGANTLTIRAYVKGEPKAIADQTIERGPFNAIATFSLEYE
jgi:type 1 fimbria pilin